MTREQEITEYLKMQVEARAVDILAHLNTINSYQISYGSLKFSLSKMEKAGMITRTKEHYFKIFNRAICPYTFAGNFNKIGVNYEQIGEIVCDVFQVTLEQLQSKKRYRELVDARKAFFYYSVDLKKKKELPESLKKIGAMLGKDHSTVIHSVTEAKNLLICDQDFKRKMAKVKRKIDFESITFDNISENEETISYFYNKPEELVKHYDLVQ